MFTSQENNPISQEEKELHHPRRVEGGEVEFARAKVILVYSPKVDLGPIKIVEHSNQRKMVATTPIPSGTVVCEEEALFSYEKGSEERFPSILRGLNHFDLLHLYIKCQINLYPHTEADLVREFQGIGGEAAHFKAPETQLVVYSQFNSYDDGDRRHLFLTASAFNHSCYPNCCHVITRNKIIVFTLRDITAGEELCIWYWGGNSTFLSCRDIDTRRAFITAQMNFTCSCLACTGAIAKSPADLAEEQLQLGEKSPIVIFAKKYKQRVVLLS